MTSTGNDGRQVTCPEELRGPKTEDFHKYGLTWSSDILKCLAQDSVNSCFKKRNHQKRESLPRFERLSYLGTEEDFQIELVFDFDQSSKLTWRCEMKQIKVENQFPV